MMPARQLRPLAKQTEERLASSMGHTNLRVTGQNAARGTELFLGPISTPWQWDLKFSANFSTRHGGDLVFLRHLHKRLFPYFSVRFLGFKFPFRSSPLAPLRRRGILDNHRGGKESVTLLGGFRTEGNGRDFENIAAPQP
jgi:hypothetical protein